MDATVTPTYDSASRLTRIDDTQSGFVQWSYDDANKILCDTVLVQRELETGALGYSQIQTEWSCRRQRRVGSRHSFENNSLRNVRNLQ